MIDQILFKLNELIISNQELKKSQAELLVMMQAIAVTPQMKGEVWLSKKQVMALLFIEERTFYRRKKKYCWTEKWISGTTYFLEESVLMDQS